MFAFAVSCISMHVLTWTMPEEAVFDLFRLSLAIFATVLRGGVRAATAAILCSITAADSACGPLAPWSPATMY